MTNAHVVAGVDEPDGPDRRRGQLYDATVVLYDWQRDIAVLDVPGPDASRRCSSPTETRAAATDAIVAGFPENGAVRRAAGADPRPIDGQRPGHLPRAATVTPRRLLAIRAPVRQGNSGGPLLTPSGKVYGVVFAAALDNKDTGYVLTADEVAPDAQRRRQRHQRGLHPVLLRLGLDRPSSGLCPNVDRVCSDGH